MDAIKTDANYLDLPPILIAASSDNAMTRAESGVIAAGYRVGARMPIESAAERIDQQLSAAGLWVEIDSDRGAAMDDLLRHISNARFATIVSASSELIDPVAACVQSADVELIVDPDEAERAAALAIAMARRAMPLSVNDIASDNNAERLRQLSEEVSRIASTLARLSTGPGGPPRSPEPVPASDVPPLSAETVRSVIRARRLRARYFREELFADPAWDMLLDLLQAEIAQLRVPVSSLCIAASVPATTALRWLKTMVGQGLFVRRADPHDGRRVFVELAPDASQALRRYFAEIGPVAVV
jgi:DNA-binding MarR family transcriptional regulator